MQISIFNHRYYFSVAKNIHFLMKLRIYWVIEKYLSVLKYLEYDFWDKEINLKILKIENVFLIAQFNMERKWSPFFSK